MPTNMDPNHILSGVLVAAMRSDLHATNISGFKYFLLGFKETHSPELEVTIKVIVSDAIASEMTGNGVRWVQNPSQDNPNQNAEVTFGRLFKLGGTNPEWRIENVTHVGQTSVEQPLP